MLRVGKSNISVLLQGLAELLATGITRYPTQQSQCYIIKGL